MNIFPMAENADWKTNQEKDVLSFLSVWLNTNSSTDSPAFFNDNVDKLFVKELQTIPLILKLYI